MADNLTMKILKAHLVEGELIPGREIAIRIDQTLLQDATGTMAMLEFEAMGVDRRLRTKVSVQYVDHNLLQTDFKNADDHTYLRTASARYGLVYSPPGNGICHQVHMERFGVPGKTMIGSDSSHSRRGRGLHDGHRRRGPGCGPGHGRPALQLSLSQGFGGSAHGRAARLGQRQGPHPGDAPPVRRQGLRGQGGRVSRPRGGQPLGHGPGDHRQHGHRAGRHHHHLPL